MADDTTEQGGARGESEGGDLAIGRGVVIPARELAVRVSRSSGPGGQRVNKVATRVSLIWNVELSEALDDAQRSRLRERLRKRLTVKGDLVVHAQASREQARNRAEARRRLAALVAEALAPPSRPRRPTKPTRGSVERRVDEKRHRSATKRTRRPAPHDHD